jgi:hypothetical protein
MLQVTVIITDSKLYKALPLNCSRTTVVADLDTLKIIIRVKNRGAPVLGIGSKDADFSILPAN